MTSQFDFKNFVKYNNNIPIDAEILNQKDFEKYVIKEVNIKSQLESTISAYVLLPKNKFPNPGVHFIHWLETEAENSNKDEFLPMAKELADMGIASILPDCFWSLDPEEYERNPDKYRKDWWQTDTEYDKRLIRRQLIELKTVEDYFINLPNIKKENTILAAHDFGAMFGILLSKLGHNYSSYVLMAFTSRWSDWFRFGSQKNEKQLEHYVESLENLAPINYIMDLSPSSLLLQFADDDFYIPVERANLILDIAKKPKEMRIYNAKHGMNKKAFDDMKKWIVNKFRKSSR